MKNDRKPQRTFSVNDGMINSGDYQAAHKEIMVKG